MINKRIVFIVLVATALAGNVRAQEVCDNGVDDDGDGLIDLNDSTDCSCGSVVVGTQVPSLLPNSSFEDHECCPTSWSQFNCVSAWEQATITTTDYYHTCGYVPSIATQPFPDGDGIAAALFSLDWKEYIGACLLQPMVAGTEYDLHMYVAALRSSGFLETSSDLYGAVDLTIYGSPACSGFPLTTFGCPLSFGYSELGHVSYVPSSSWGEAVISFIPSYDVEAVIIGSPCVLPSSYEQVDGGLPYFFYDGLTLNKSSLFRIVISSEGALCANDARLVGPCCERKNLGNKESAYL